MARLLTRIAVSLFAAMACLAPVVTAQPMRVDPTFAPELLNDQSAISSLNATSLADTSLLVRGAFSHLDGAPAAGLARLLPDGARDPAFTGTFARQIRLVTPLPGGRLIAITDSRDRAAPSLLERLLPDGSPDASYPPLSLPNATIVRLVPQPDGRVLIAGSFTALGSLARTNLARLRDDGTLDPTFDAGRQLNFHTVTTNGLVAQADGKVLLNTVTTVTDLPFAGLPPTFYGLTRFNTDGTVDSAFGLTPSPNGTIAISLSSDPYHTLAVQPDGKILAATGSLFVRFNSNGVKDTTFTPSIPGLRRIDHVVTLADGRSIVQARVSLTPSATNLPLTPSSVFLLDPNGAVVRDFRASLPANVAVELLASPPAGPVTVRYGVPYLTNALPTSPIDPGINVMPTDVPTTPVAPSDASVTPVTPQTPVTTYFSPVIALARPALARFDLSGTRAPRFAPAFTSRTPVTVSQMFADSAGRLVVSGAFTSVNGALRPGLARFLADGSLDTSFLPPQSGELALVQPDGKILLRDLLPGFVNTDGLSSPTPAYQRLLADGSPDLTFKITGLPPAAIIHSLGPDGRLLASGFEPDATREEHLKLYRLNPDGSRAATLSTSFRGFHTFSATVLTPAGTAVTDYEHPNQIRALHPLPDGKFFVIATVTTINGTATNGFARLNPDGTTDLTYRPALNGSLDPVFTAEVSFLSAGRVLYNAPRRFDSPLLPSVRLLADGSLDPTFTPLPGTVISRVVELSDQTLLSDSGTQRWLSDGSPDLNYSVTLNSGSYTSHVTEASGRIYLGGNFISVNGQPCSGLARLIPVETAGFTHHPQSQTVVAGRDLAFQAALGTSTSAIYQWTRNGLPVSGATASALILRPAKLADAGTYRLIATTGGQTYTSTAATLTVTPNTARLVNFSARSRVSSDTPPQIAGFVLRGAAPRPVLLRATGSGLPTFFVPSTTLLRKPVLRTFQGGLLLAENTGAPLTPAVAAVAQKVGAFPLSDIAFPMFPPFTGSAALLLALPAGSYTTHTVSGDGQPGLALFEYYDAADATAPPALANASILARTAPGADALIAGFVVSGNGPLQILIRGLGPALTRFGVTDAVTDPHLDLFAGRWLLAQSTAWTGDPALTAAARRAGAFALPATSRDTAVLLTLEPGAYTAQLSSASGATGAAMIELYVVEP